MIGFAKSFKNNNNNNNNNNDNNNNNNKTMSFKVTDKKLLKNYTKIWGKVSNLMNVEFDSEPVYGDNDEYIKRIIKTYGEKVNINFQDKKVPKEKVLYNFLSQIMLDSVIRVSEKYYPQTLSEECKYEIKNTKMENLINDDLEPRSSDDETDNDSDNESGNETSIESDNE